VDRVFSRVKKAEIFLKTAIRMTTTLPRSFMPYALETAVLNSEFFIYHLATGITSGMVQNFTRLRILLALIL